MLGCAALLLFAAPLAAQSLEADLQRMPATELAAWAKSDGDAARGAVVFFGAQLACSKCHAVGDEAPAPLGPDLTKLARDMADEAIIESVLWPSKVIREGYATATVITTDGKSLSALVVQRTGERLVLRDIQRPDELITLAADEVEEVKISDVSLMPAGQINQLASRQQFLDLLSYLFELRDGGAERARQLQPHPSLIAPPLPEYEQRLDHAGLIADWNAAALKRGEATYQRVCANCHGDKDRVGSLPTSLRFAEGKFKNGSDPLSMYRTLTHGFGLMPAQTWMAPSQKYDVIHYLRETYLRPHNPTQLTAVTADYLASLPKGDTRGPAPSKIEPWSAMDYGPSLAHTYEIPGGERNFAYKGIAVRLDPGAGGVSRGRHWMVFDTDTLRVAAAWSAAPRAEESQNFIDWRGIQFNGQHQVHPRVVGEVHFANSAGPGWAEPTSGSFRDDQRVVGRDNRNYGPLPRSWARYRGLYHHGQQVVLSYSVGEVEVLESPRWLQREGDADSDTTTPIFLRTFNLGPRPHDLVLQVAQHPQATARAQAVEPSQGAIVRLQSAESAGGAAGEAAPPAFTGDTFLEVPRGERFDLSTQDFTIAARLKTTAGGTIFALAQPGPKWTPDGQSLFVRDGRLCWDIGWVGVVASRTKINDGQWHNVAMTWRQADRRVRLYIDGRLDAEGSLAAKAKLPNSVVRIGYTAPNFPLPQSHFRGELAEVRFYQRLLPEGSDAFADPPPEDDTLVARWRPSEVIGEVARDLTGRQHDAAVHRGAGASVAVEQRIVAGFAPPNTPVEWIAADGHLRLKIPAGRQPLKFTVWTAAESPAGPPKQGGPGSAAGWEVAIPDAAGDLARLTQGGPPRWPQRLETQAVLGRDAGPFAIDALTPPEANPWLAQTRLTGLDFFADGRLAVCSWDGDVWVVEQSAGDPLLRWQRIASGLFQPLGLKIVDERIHVICRDQLAVLHDLNGDGEIDYYECLNNDHQVTEHFHEFAMGLQTDDAGNFYYAKSARHALPAVVPHHGTLLRVSRDGARTDLVAVGFRAANGVCLNPDGSFVVTDQEGHWNPKNRINWVTPSSSGEPKFYGNMFGYHGVVDSADAAMEPPLCWITNAFDRSPAELLWVDSQRWGPLAGSLLNLSYGYGKAFLVPHEKVGGLMQGGMIELPIPAFPTGLMRGRFHPQDGQLYLCGMNAWGSSTARPGGLYRLRATGQPMHLPVALQAVKSGLRLTFSDPLDAAALDATSVQIKTWSLKRTASYGSQHHDERPLEIRAATLSADGKMLTLDIPDIAPTWCMEIKYSLRSATGTPVRGTLHNTIHALAE